LKDLLSNNKGEVNHIRRIVLACERDMEDFTAAMDAVNVDLDEMRARVDATHSIITSRQRVEATMTAEISTMRLDIGDIQEALKNHDSWMEDVSNTLQQMQEKEENLTEDIINLKNEMNTKLDTKVDNVAWKEANDDLDAAIKTVRDMVFLCDLMLMLAAARWTKSWQPLGMISLRWKLTLRNQRRKLQVTPTKQ